jgi:two-component system sensor histidine kinase DesK
VFSSDVDEYRPVGVWARLTHRSAFRWYPGALIGLLYQISVLGGLWTSSGAVATKVVATALLTLVYVGFLALPPVLWWEGERTRLIGVLGYFALTLTLIPFIGIVTLWTWVYVACAAGMAIARTWVSAAVICGLGLVQLIVLLLTGTFDDYWFIALITVSIGIMMSAFARQIDALRRLRNAQGEIARLAVVEERARFSRDMHDVLGHSLTVVTVKSELARRLIPVDPGRAEEELADIERLTRSALADLRAAVAGYREMSLSTELAAAQAGLAAADIQAHLPRNGEEVDPDLRELFGWVLREGVTNVIRHSGSRNCWVTVEPEMLRIEDDGRGPAPVGSERRDLVRGSGIAGLAARAGESGAALTVEAGPRGGTLLTVRRLP